MNPLGHFSNVFYIQYFPSNPVREQEYISLMLNAAKFNKAGTGIEGTDLERDDLKDWRPISLTNSDYKLLAKYVALRLGDVINDVVSGNQVGFLKWGGKLIFNDFTRRHRRNRFRKR